MNQFERTEILIGQESMRRLSSKRVAIFGVGGVGGYTAEALARCGVGALDLFDNDTVSFSNLNRQIIALHSTVGRFKVDVMCERILDINPNASVLVHRVFYLPENADKYDLSVYDYVVDAIDTVSGKLEIIVRCKKAGVRVISAMGAGNKLDPTRFEVSDIYKTSVCPLARVMRRELRSRGVKDLKVVYSREEPVRSEPGSRTGNERFRDEKETAVSGRVPGSVSFVPSAAGLIIAGEVVRELAGLE